MTATNACLYLQVSWKVGSTRKSFNSKLPAFVSRHCPTWVTTALSSQSTRSRFLHDLHVITSFTPSSFFPPQFSYFPVCRVLCMFSLKLGGCRSPQSLYSFNWPFSQFMVTWDSCKWDFSRVGSHNLCDRIETSAQLCLDCHSHSWHILPNNHREKHNRVTKELSDIFSIKLWHRNYMLLLWVRKVALKTSVRNPSKDYRTSWSMRLPDTSWYWCGTHLGMKGCAGYMPPSQV